jgi:hypothetical protein
MVAGAGTAARHPRPCAGADIMEHVAPIFYGDPKTAAMKALGLT